MPEKLTNCCGVPAIDDCDLCPQCKEHCDVESDEDEDVCPSCKGESSRDGKNCKKCKGSGTSRPSLGRW